MRGGEGLGGEERLAAALDADRAPGELATGREHEGREAIRLAHGTGAEPRDDGGQDVLREVRRRRLVAQVAQPVEPDAGAEPPAQRLLGRAVTGRGTPRERSVRGVLGGARCTRPFHGHGVIRARAGRRGRPFRGA